VLGWNLKFCEEKKNVKRLEFYIVVLDSVLDGKGYGGRPE